MVQLLCLFFLLSGCARLPIVGADSARINSTAVARLDAAALFSAATGGKLVAFSLDGVRVAPLPTGESHIISVERPEALAWSPDGRRLAVAFGRGTKSRIAVFGSDGSPEAETGVAGRIIALFWPGSDALLAFSMELEPHPFGTFCRETLLRWQLSGAPERTVLHEVTLKPYTVRRLESRLLARAISPSISLQGDELVYGRIQDPPAFDAYLKIMVRNLSSGVEREFAKTGFGYGAARFSADGDELLMDNGSGRTGRFDAWSGTEKEELPYSGRFLSVSPDGRHLLADGRLLDDGRESVLFPPRTTGEFLDDGRLLVSIDSNLFLVSGFEAAVAGSVMLPEIKERLRILRAWRASGLISADDYVIAKDKVLK